MANLRKRVYIVASLAFACILHLQHSGWTHLRLRNVTILPMHASKSCSKTVTTTEVKHVMFLKVHKTGSSTTQNLFLRYGHDNNLTFILGSVENNECGGSLNCISFVNTLTDKNIWPPPVNKSFDILCSHVIYNRESFKKYLPTDTVNIGIVREPVERLASAINYFDLLKNTSFSTYANDPAHFNHNMLNNRMAFEFGFNKKLLLVTSNRSLTDIQRIEASNYIDQLHNDFSLIIVNEKFYESLVIMKRMLNWSTKDILFYKKMKSESSYRTFNERDRTKLKNYLYLDYLLYDYAVKQLDTKIAVAGDGLKEEVAEFAALNEQVLHYCRQEQTGPNTINATKWHNGFIVEYKLCCNLRKLEIPFLEKIRNKQYNKMT